jgi:hypothetical protein
MELLILRIKSVLDNFIIAEKELLVQDSHEEAITGSLLGFLRQEFTDLEFDIDTQYNRRILDNELMVKTAEFLIYKLPLNKWPAYWEGGQKSIKKEILPDFIFHKRQNSENNFLIIELKKSTNKDSADRDWDHLKLREMTRRELNYDYGLFIELSTGADYGVGNNYAIVQYSDGEIIYQE